MTDNDLRCIDPFTGLRLLHLHAYLLEGTDRDMVSFADWEVPGIYLVQVPPELDDAHAANCALDGFHSQVAIERLHMFHLTVREPLTGQELERDDSLDHYELADQCGDVMRL